MLTGRDAVVRVLDGEDTIGGSKILVGWGGEGAFLDFGINYSRWGAYFEEYVKPRTSYGVGDLWRLGLVPQVQGLYRPDLIPQGLPAGADLPVRCITGVYVSHAHMDHAGLIGLLRPEVPLVTSRMTAAILKAVQDSGKSDIFSQSVYSTPYEPGTVGRQQVLRAKKGADYVGRDLYLTDGEGSATFQRFWSLAPGRSAEEKRAGTRGLAAGSLKMHQPTSGGPQAKEFQVDHSVLGSSGFVLESPQGAIAYTGDVRAHGERAASTRRFLESLVHHPPWVLLAEGTQVRRRAPRKPEEDPFVDEKEVEANCHHVVQAHPGQLVVADFAPRNIERLQAFLRIARATGRRLVITPKDAYLLHAMHTADDSVPTPGDLMLVYDPPAGNEDKWERWVLDEYRAHVVHGEEVARRQGELILCLSYFDIKHLLDVRPQRGVYIYSSSEAHSEEQQIDMERLHNWLTLFNLKPVGFHMVPDEGLRRRLKPVFEPGFHASGHMPGDEMLEWIERIRPDHLLPVHTEHADLFRERFEGTGIRILKGGIG